MAFLDPHLLDNSTPMWDHHTRTKEKRYRERPEVRARQAETARRWKIENREYWNAYKREWYHRVETQLRLRRRTFGQLHGEQRTRSLDGEMHRSANFRAEGRALTWHEAVGAESSPEEQLMTEELYAVVGDLTEEDIARLGERELERLRREIEQVGVPRPAIQRTERERLREPTSHRGEPAAPTKQRMASRHRGRKEASRLMKDRGAKFKRHK